MSLIATNWATLADNHLYFLFYSIFISLLFIFRWVHFHFIIYFDNYHKKTIEISCRRGRSKPEFFSSSYHSYYLLINLTNRCIIPVLCGNWQFDTTKTCVFSYKCDLCVCYYCRKFCIYLFIWGTNLCISKKFISIRSHFFRFWVMWKGIRRNYYYLLTDFYFGK